MHYIELLSIEYQINKWILHKEEKNCLVISSTTWDWDFGALVLQVVAHQTGGALELNLNIRLNIRPNN